MSTPHAAEAAVKRMLQPGYDYDYDTESESGLDRRLTSE